MYRVLHETTNLVILSISIGQGLIFGLLIGRVVEMLYGMSFRPRTSSSNCCLRRSLRIYWYQLTRTPQSRLYSPTLTAFCELDDLNTFSSYHSM